MSKTWKAAERAIAKRLGGQRTSALGLGRCIADVETEALSVEVKTRKEVPRWLLEAVEQSKRNAGDKVALVVLHKVGQRHDNDLVIMTLSDFLFLLEDGE